MSRPRAMTSRYCFQCRVRVFANEQEAQAFAEHRYLHRKLDRRRAQWRASKARKRQQQPSPYGFLHSVTCRGQHREGWRGCVPIPVYLIPPEAA